MTSDPIPQQFAFIQELFGTYRMAIQERFAVYIADKGKGDIRVDMDMWAGRALRLLDEINTGATALPAALGMWEGDEERTIIVYSFVDRKKFFDNILRIRRFLHKYGVDAKQKAVLFEYGTTAFWIRDSDYVLSPADLAQTND